MRATISKRQWIIIFVISLLIFMSFTLLTGKDSSIQKRGSHQIAPINSLNHLVKNEGNTQNDPNNTHDLKQDSDTGETIGADPKTSSNPKTKLDKIKQSTNHPLTDLDRPEIPPHENALQDNKRAEENTGFVPLFLNSYSTLEDQPDLKKRLTAYYRSIGYFTKKERNSFVDYDDSSLLAMSLTGDLLANEVLLRRALKQYKYKDAKKLLYISRIFGNASASPYVEGSASEGFYAIHMLRARMGDYLILFQVATRKSKRTPEQTRYANRKSLEFLEDINNKRNAKGLQPLPIKPDNDVIRYHQEIFSEFNVDGYLEMYLNFEIEDNEFNY